MADISDVVTLLAQMSEAAAYPNGTGAPSVVGARVQIVGGWPLASALDNALKAGEAMVSVFPQAGQSASVYQILDDEPYILVPAVHGVTAVIEGQKVTVYGTPTPGEYVTIIVNNHHAYSRTADVAGAALIQIAKDAAADYPGVDAISNYITWPVHAATIKCNIGAPATAARITHRQRAMLAISIWAPTPAMRDQLAAAVDVSLKMTNRLVMPDKTQAVLANSHTTQFDQRQTASVYRRDLVFAVDYATIEQFKVYEITSFEPTIVAESPAIVGDAPSVTLALG